MRHFAMLAAAAALPWTVFAQADFNWSGMLSPGQTLEIKGVNGSIRAELATGNMIEVTARKTANRSDPASVRIEVVPTSDGVTICSVYPSGGTQANYCEGGRGGHSDVRDNDVTVDFSVKVPAGVRFAPKTVNGSVTALGLRSDVNGASVNGNVKIRTTGLATAKSVNGSIEAAMGVAFWNGSLDFKTVNGSIDLTLPPGASADIHAASMSGNFRSDFPVTMNGRLEERKTEGRIGAGGRDLNLTTVNGAITLHQGE
jgi:putative adhesin